MTQDSAGFEYRSPAPAGYRVESAGGVLLSVANYGHLRLLIDKEIGNFKDSTRDLVFKGCVESGAAQSALV